MTISKLWTEFSLKLHALTAQAAAAVYIDGIKSQGVNSQLQTVVEGGDGNVFNTFGSLVSGAPLARLTTNDLKTILDELPINAGMLVDSDGTHPGVVMYFQRMAQGGTRDAVGAGTHVSATIESGIMVPRTLEVSHQSPAILSAEVIARQVGAVTPVQFNVAANLDAVTPGVDELWTMGPVDLNTVVVNGLQSVSIDFGIGVVSETRDSDIFPTFNSIRSIQPSVRMTGVHIDILSELTDEGKFYSASTVRIFLRKRDEGGTFVIDATAEHILLTLGKCRVDWESVDGDPKSINLTLTPWATAGGANPIALNTASAIT